MEEAKITLKLLFKYIEEDRRKQCIKESEFMVCMNSKIHMRKNSLYNIFFYIIYLSIYKLFIIVFHHNFIIIIFIIQF